MRSARESGGMRERRGSARKRGADMTNAIAWCAFAITIMSGTFALYNRIDLGLAQSNAASVMSAFSAKRTIQNAFEQKNCDKQLLEVLSGTGAAFEQRTLPRGYKVEPGSALISDEREVLHVPYGGVAEYSVLGVVSESAILSGSFCRDAKVASANPVLRASPIIQQASYSPAPAAFLMTASGGAGAMLIRGPYRAEEPLFPILAAYAGEPDESVFGKLILGKGNSGNGAQTTASNGKGNGKGNSGNNGNSGNSGNGNSGNNGIGNGGADAGNSPGNSGGNAHCPKDPHHDHGPGGHDNGIGNDKCGGSSAPAPEPAPQPPVVNPPVETPLPPATPEEPVIPTPGDPAPPVIPEEPGPQQETTPEEQQTPRDPSETQPPADDPQPGVVIPPIGEPQETPPVEPAPPVEEPTDSAPTDPAAPPEGPATPIEDPAQPEQPSEPDTPPEPVDEEPAPEEYPQHLTRIDPGEIVHTLTVYWNNDSHKARALCRYMASLDNGEAYVGQGPMGNNYIVRGASCDSEIPELTVVYQ